MSTIPLLAPTPPPPIEGLAHPTMIYDYAKLETIAELGGYVPRPTGANRVNVADVHEMYSGLLESRHPEAQAAMVAVGALRKWLVHGDARPPDVRGASFVRSDRQVWVAYTTHPNPALLRGTASQFDDLRRYLAATATPQYDGSLGVRTKPMVLLRRGDDSSAIDLTSPDGVVRLDVGTNLQLQNWLNVTLLRRDRRVVVCLPGAWQLG